MPQDDTRDPALRRLASRISLVVALILVGVKFLGWLATGSVALLTSAVDALVDTGASLVTYSASATPSARPIATTASAMARGKPSQASPRPPSSRAPPWCLPSSPSSG